MSAPQDEIIQRFRTADATFVNLTSSTGSSSGATAAAASSLPASGKMREAEEAQRSIDTMSLQIQSLEAARRYGRIGLGFESLSLFVSVLLVRQGYIRADAFKSPWGQWMPVPSLRRFLTPLGLAGLMGVGMTSYYVPVEVAGLRRIDDMLLHTKAMRETTEVRKLELLGKAPAGQQVQKE
jgi:hypothetical protein